MGVISKKVSEGSLLSNEQAIEVVMDSFPCELAVHLLPTEERSWRVNVSAGERGRRVQGATLCGRTPIPPWGGALVGRRAFSDAVAASSVGPIPSSTGSPS